MSEQTGTTQPDRMLTPRLWRLTTTIIEKSGTPSRARRVRAVSTPVGAMAIRVDRRGMGDGTTRFSAAAFVYDAVDEGVLTIHRHDVYRGKLDESVQVEAFTRRFIIDPTVGSLVRRRTDNAEDFEGVREAVSVMRSITRARVGHDPFVTVTAHANLSVVLDAVAADSRDTEAYFHPQILEAFSLPPES